MKPEWANEPRQPQNTEAVTPENTAAAPEISPKGPAQNVTHLNTNPPYSHRHITQTPPSVTPHTAEPILAHSPPLVELYQPEPQQSPVPTDLVWALLAHPSQNPPYEVIDTPMPDASDEFKFLRQLCEAGMAGC